MTLEGYGCHSLTVAIPARLGQTLNVSMPPWENGHNELLNGKLPDELVNGEILYTPEENASAYQTLATTRNTMRPYCARLQAPSAGRLNPNLQLGVARGGGKPSGIGSSNLETILIETAGTPTSATRHRRSSLNKPIQPEKLARICMNVGRRVELSLNS